MMQLNPFDASQGNDTSLAHSSATLTNTSTKEQFIQRARQYGEDTAKGIDAKPKFFLDLVRMSAQGVVEPYDPKVHNADNPDDTARAYDAYLEAASEKAIHEHTKDGKKANTSKFRVGVNVGRHPHVDGEDLMDKTRDIYSATREAQGPKAVLPAFEVYVNVGRAQMKSETALSDDEIKGLCMKPEPKSLEAEKVIEKMFKTGDKLIAGEYKAPNGDTVTVEGDAKDKLIEAVELLREALATFATERKLQELYKLQVELGHIPAQIEHMN